jgi:hypothetical protein
MLGRRIAISTMACLVVLNGVATAASRPDLVAAGVKARGTHATPGGSLPVSATVKNTGAKAGATKTAFYLSKDRTKGKGDPLLGRKSTGRIAAGRSTSVRLGATVPASTQAGSYRVLACADDAKQIRESNEGNNCKASTGMVGVTAAYDSTPFGPASPTDVTAPVDESASVTTLVSASSGGQVVLTRDGSTFTLDVPAGALLVDQQITMTALSSLSGDPFGGFAAGVQLQPEGLTFEKPVTLSMDLATPVPISNEKTWASKDSGEGFHLYPVAIEPVDPTFSLLHFTKVGVSDSTSQTSVPNPVDPAAALEQQIGDIYEDARKRNHTEDEGLTEAELEQIAELGRHFYDVVVKPLLVEASNDAACENIKKKQEAIKQGILWARQMELAAVDGFMGGRIDEMYGFIGKIEQKKCAFPNEWTGTMGGTYSDSSTGLTEMWSATVTFTKDSEDPFFATYTGAGSITWSINDTDDQGCHYSGSDTLGAGGLFSGGSISLDPDLYGFQLLKTEAFVPVNRSCPGPPPSSGEITYIALNSGRFAETSSHPYDRGLTLKGSRSYTPGDAPDVTVTLDWNLNAG